MADYEIVLEGAEEIIEILNEFPEIVFNKTVFSEISEYSIAKMLQRTLSGKGPDGKIFKKYSPRYKKFREEKGRQGFPVNLNFHGDMLNSLTYKSTDKGATLFFMNTSDRNNVKNPDKAFYNHQTRNFFALSEEEIQGIIKVIDGYIGRAIGDKNG